MRFLDDWLLETVGHANTLGVAGKACGRSGHRGLFILGTDTDVGKSYVGQLIIRHLVVSGQCVGAYKPVASGVAPSQLSDAQRLLEATRRDWPLERVCPQAFAAPLAPPVSAAREGKVVDEQLLRSGARWWSTQCDVLVVEGAGGALSPISRRCTVLDLAADLTAEFGYPVVLVAAHRLGMMNHVLLTLEAVRARRLPLLAVIVNQVSGNPGTASELTGGETAGDNFSVSGNVVELSESLECLLPFCGKIACYSLDYGGSTLSPVVQSASIKD